MERRINVRNIVLAAILGAVGTVVGFSDMLAQHKEVAAQVATSVSSLFASGQQPAPVFTAETLSSTAAMSSMSVMPSVGLILLVIVITVFVIGFAGASMSFCGRGI